MTMKCEDYDEIVSKDAPGPNADKDKAERLRSFVMPARFVNRKSSNPDRTRFINVIAAFVSNDNAILIVDFSRLSRLHVTSLDRPWQEADFDPSSSVSACGGAMI